MNRNDDFDKTLTSWLHRQAPSQAPDRVLDAALERVAVQSQRRGWLQSLIGETPVTIMTRMAAVAAVAALAAFIGFQFGNLSPDIGGQSPSPSVEPTPQQSPEPSAEALPSLSPVVGCLDSPPDVEALIEFQDGTRDDAVACFGDAPLTFDANWVGGGVADCPTMPQPAWLACSAFSLRPVGDTSKVGAPQLSVAVDPATSPLPEVGSDVRVTGHFDDAAAQTCRDTEPEPGAETPAPAAEIIERCRNSFVITAVVALER